MEGVGEKHRTGSQRVGFSFLAFPSTSQKTIGKSPSSGCNSFVPSIKQGCFYFHLPILCLACLSRVYTFKDHVSDLCPGKHGQQEKQQKAKVVLVRKTGFFYTQHSSTDLRNTFPVQGQPLFNGRKGLILFLFSNIYSLMKHERNTTES